jgi:hypothetical protein
MKPVLLITLMILVSTVSARSPYEYDYVYYHPTITSNAAPFSFYERPRKEKYWIEKPRQVGRIHRRIIYSPGSYAQFHDPVYLQPRKPCNTHNNVVKEINGGAPRFVLNGTYSRCNRQQRGEMARNVTNNFGWAWNRSQPSYRKVPVYVEDSADWRRYDYAKDESTRENDRVHRTYYYR